MPDNALVVPPVVTASQQSSEILRVWIADGGLVCNLMPDAFPEPEAWGLVLSDVARHVGNALAENSDVDADEVVRGIVHLLNAEMDHPTDTPQGEYLQ